MIEDDFIETGQATYEAKSSDELIRIAYLDNDDYRREAVALARSILAERGIDGPHHEEVQAARPRIAAQSHLGESVDTSPLPTAFKALCVVVPLIGLLLAIVKHLRGNHGAAVEAWIFTVVGFAASVVFRAIAQLLGWA